MLPSALHMYIRTDVTPRESKFSPSLKHWPLRLIFNFAPRGEMWPPGFKLSSRGEDPSVRPSVFFLNSRQCSVLGVTEGVIISPRDQRDQSSTLGPDLLLGAFSCYLKHWPQCPPEKLVPEHIVSVLKWLVVASEAGGQSYCRCFLR
jgi:hypothetical protein